jgi:group I intron endonuclease
MANLSNSKLIGIYKITSPSGRIYIGQSIDINKRFTGYYSMTNVRWQRKLKASLLKYGPMNHTYEVIEECLVDQLNERERYWQEYYDSANIKTGLNIVLTNTREKKAVVSEESRRLMSLSRTGEKNHMYGRRGSDHPLFGTKASEEVRRKLSQSKKGVPKPLSQRKKIGEANARRVIKEETRQKHRDQGKAFVGTNNPFYGKVHNRETLEKIQAKRSQTMLCRDHPMKGKKHSEESRLKNTLSHIGKGLMGDNHNAKPVIDINTGVFYSCVKEAADIYGLNRHNLARKIRGERRNDTPFRFA